MGELQTLPNIGAEVERQLHNVGITTIAELRAVGSKEAWLRILAHDPSACINRLGGLEGAVRGVRRVELEEDLRAFYRHYKPGKGVSK